MTAQLQTRFAKAARPARVKPPRIASKPSRPVTIRFTHDERARLEQEAGERTLSAHVRSRLFGAKQHRGPDRRPSVDSVALARVLAMLGQSAVSTNLAAVTMAIRTGTLDAGPMTLAMLNQACTDVACMRRDLIRALGIKPE